MNMASRDLQSIKKVKNSISQKRYFLEQKLSSVTLVILANFGGVTEVAFFDRTHHLRDMKNRLFQIQLVVADQARSEMSKTVCSMKKCYFSGSPKAGQNN